MATSFESSGCPFSEQASGFDPFDAAYQLDPAEALRWSRDKEPVFYSEILGYWVISRYEDVKDVFRDPLVFSPAIALEKISPAPPQAADILKSYGYAMNRTMVNEDEPDHMIRRRLLMDAFLPARLDAQTAMIRQLTRQSIDRFVARGTADLVAEMFWEIPMEVALRFLGVDADDISELKSFSVAHTVNTWGRPRPEEQLHVADSVGRFWQASGAILDKMRANPDGTGWMYDSIRQNKLRPEIVTDSYLQSMMMAILVAAHETTAHASANAVMTLLKTPGAWAELVANPGLIPNAVEECLRFAGSVVAWRRITTCATTVGGIAIPEGARLLIVQASANHDPRAFENPENLDLYRDNATDHLTFGYGAHQCMGKNIARLEMRIFLEELTRRLPHLTLAEQTFHYVPNTSFRGPRNLLVEWDATRNPELQDPAILEAAQDFPVGPPAKSDIRRRVRVQEAVIAQGNILHLHLTDPQGRPLPDWSAGAHIDLVAHGITRKYSLCGAGEDAGTFRIAILREDTGRGGSVHFHDTLKTGDTVYVAGPRNHFRLDETAEEYMLIAGGIGITPILGMADRLKALGKRYTLHYAGKSQDGMALLERAQRDHGAALHIYASVHGQRMDLPRLTSAFPETGKIYACGPEQLLNAVDALTANGPEGWLTFESFSAVDVMLDPSKEHAFTVHLSDSARDITVRADQTVLDALTQAGIDVPCDCREGLCGSCEVAVSDGTINHRDKVLTQAERSAGDRMMTCCSRAAGGRITLRL